MYLWYEMGSPLHRICVLEVRGGQGALGDQMDLFSLVDQQVLVAQRPLLYPQSHIHPKEMFIRDHIETYKQIMFS